MFFRWLEKFGLIAFVITAALYSLGTFVEPYALSWLLKVAPLIFLISYSMVKTHNDITKVFILGLIFSMIGDFTLGFYGKAGFLFGLAAFFLAHIFYIVSFGRWEYHKKSFAIALVMIVIAILLLRILYDELGALKIPVIAYMIILLIMSLSTLFSIKTNNWLVVGGLSFVLSDSLLGLNKFHGVFPYAQVLIILSYYLAQFSLVKGLSGNNRKYEIDR